MDATEKAPTANDSATWHALPADEVARQFATDLDKGLDTGEAQSRLQKYGPNRLPEGKTRGALARFLAQFNNILVYVLLGAGFYLFGLGEFLHYFVFKINMRSYERNIAVRSGQLIPARILRELRRAQSEIQSQGGDLP